MSKDNVALVVNYQGGLPGAAKALDAEVEKELRSKIGLSKDDVSFAGDVVYTVTLRPLGDHRTSNARAGTSTVSVEDAVQKATKGDDKGYDHENVSVNLERTVEAPYFTVPVVVRSLSPEKLAGYHAEAVHQLLNTYGTRVNQNPDSVEFRVLKTKKQYNHDGMLPKDEQCWVARKLFVVAEGRSNVSVDEAMQRAQTSSKKVNSTVYEQRAEIIVYGHPEPSLKLSEEGLAFPMVITASKTQPRGAQPAARDPVALTSSYALM